MIKDQSETVMEIEDAPLLPLLLAEHCEFREESKKDGTEAEDGNGNHPEADAVVASLVRRLRVTALQVQGHRGRSSQHWSAAVVILPRTAEAFGVVKNDLVIQVQATCWTYRSHLVPFFFLAL